MDSFKGVAVAGIGGTIVGKILKDQLLPQFNSTIGLLDNKGIILYTSNKSFIGKSIFGSEVESALSSIVPASSSKELNQLLINSIKGNRSGLEDIYLQGTLNTIAFEPVTLNGTHFLSLFISTPHNLATHVAAAIEEQKNLNAIIVIVIGAAALGGAIMVITWNKRLGQTVKARTEELREANRDLVVANEQLKYHGDMQREFINVAAHELRTPIQPILSTAEILRSKIKDKGMNESLEVQIKNAKRLQRLSQDLLDVAMIEGRSLKLDKEIVDLNSLIAQVIEDQKQQILRSNNVVKLHFQSQEDQQSGDGGMRKENRILVRADAERIAQVINNLVTNAIKFTQNGTISIFTSVKSGSGSEDRSSEATVRIKDSGEGIDQEIQTRLFSKFATRSFQGTGLGLYISKKIIEYHGGKIWAENNKGEQGASFYFSLPIIGIEVKSDEGPTKNNV
jgi:signal transduction histidine kinase